jgi:hypothetical protein
VRGSAAPSSKPCAAGTYLGVPKPPSLMSRHPPSTKHGAELRRAYFPVAARHCGRVTPQRSAPRRCHRRSARPARQPGGRLHRQLHGPDPITCPTCLTRHRQSPTRDLDKPTVPRPTATYSPPRLLPIYGRCPGSHSTVAARPSWISGEASELDAVGAPNRGGFRGRFRRSNPVGCARSGSDPQPSEADLDGVAALCERPG